MASFEAMTSRGEMLAWVNPFWNRCEQVEQSATICLLSLFIGAELCFANFALRVETLFLLTCQIWIELCEL